MQKGSSESSVSNRREARSRDTSQELRPGLWEDMEAEDRGGWDENQASAQRVLMPLTELF